MATADLTVIALGRADASASRYIAEIQRRLAAQDRVRYVMHAMGTSLEGSTGDILAVAGELHAVPFEMGIPRVYSILKLDERRDREQTLDDKVTSGQALLDQPSCWAAVSYAAAAPTGAATASSQASTSSRSIS